MSEHYWARPLAVLSIGPSFTKDDLRGMRHNLSLIDLGQGAGRHLSSA